MKTPPIIDRINADHRANQAGVVLPHTSAMNSNLLMAARKVVAMTFAEARAAEDQGGRLLYCQYDALNPCFDNRPDDVPGKHWGGGDACPECNLRSLVAKADATGNGEVSAIPS